MHNSSLQNNEKRLLKVRDRPGWQWSMSSTNTYGRSYIDQNSSVEITFLIPKKSLVNYTPVASGDVFVFNLRWNALLPNCIASTLELHRKRCTHVKLNGCRSTKIGALILDFLWIDRIRLEIHRYQLSFLYL